ncbi:tripartite tricarboxylate transporter substrate binding protein [Limnohabitans sp. Rim8]|uniref:Bug family tripartite tricarboxylate transporter substrate binding protein n=1 Tax=Limnohabitans sp. Rim8 TaxID=1100718 RepID=UPI00260F50D1|nr:tripartite tricarboxylate transporter substrate binding protein [Limnohabitans sp. Rim8]
MLRRAALLMAGALLGVGVIAQPADFPNRPLRLVVPYPPGGSADLVGRMVAEKMSQSLKQSVVVDNKGGASGAIGSDFVSRAAPDGYTLLVAISDTHAINPAVMPQLPYDPQKDFVPVALMATQPMVLAVGRNMPARSLSEFVAIAKQKPRNITYASNGKGGLQHLAMELFSLSAGIETLHVPYKGAAPALSDVIGGQVDALFISLQGAGGNIGSGNLRPLAMASDKRLGVAPEVPTFTESGFAQFTVTQWYGLMAPKGTPAPLVDLLNRHARAALASPDIADKLKSVGTEPAAGSPEQFRAFLAGEIKQWAGVAKSVGVRLE